MSNWTEWFSGHLFDSLGWALLHSLWQGAVIALIYSMAMAMLRRHKPQVRYLVSLIALLAIPVAFTVTLIYMNSNISNLAQSVVSPAPQRSFPLAILLRDVVHVTSLTEISWNTIPSLFRDFVSRNLPLINMIWLTGLLFFGVRFLGGMVYAQRLRHYKGRQVGTAWQARLITLSRTVRLTRTVHMMESGLVKIPVVIGHFKPMILLPLGILTQLPPDQIQAIITHELAHIYRRDYLVNMIQALIEALFFFHPAVWWISGNIRTEREYICDDITLAAGHHPLTYSKALARVEEWHWETPSMATALARSKYQLLSRIKRIVDPSMKQSTISGGIVMLLVLIGVIAMTTTAAISVDQHHSKQQMLNKKVKEIAADLPVAQIAGIIPFLQMEPVKTIEIALSNPEALVIIPDTSKADVQKKQEEALRQYEEARKAMQEAESKLQEAQRQQYEAQHQLREAYREQYRIQMKQYRETMREYEERIRESVREYQKKLQELYPADSFGRWIPYMSFPDDHFLTLPDDLRELYNLQWHEGWYKGLDTSYHNYFYQYDSVPFPEIIIGDLPAIYKGYYYGEIPRIAGIPEIPDIMETWELPDIPALSYYTLPDLPDLEENLKWLENGDLFLNTNRYKIREVIRNELLKDDLIGEGESVIVNISSRSMTINGEKQPRDIHRKYKNLLDEALDKGFGIDGITYIY